MWKAAAEIITKYKKCWHVAISEKEKNNKSDKCMLRAFSDNKVIDFVSEPVV